MEKTSLPNKFTLRTLYLGGIIFSSIWLILVVLFGALNGYSLSPFLACGVVFWFLPYELYVANKDVKRSFFSKKLAVLTICFLQFYIIFYRDSMMSEILSFNNMLTPFVPISINIIWLLLLYFISKNKGRFKASYTGLVIVSSLVIWVFMLCILIYESVNLPHMIVFNFLDIYDLIGEVCIWLFILALWSGFVLWIDKICTKLNNHINHPSRLERRYSFRKNKLSYTVIYILSSVVYFIPVICSIMLLMYGDVSNDNFNNFMYAVTITVVQFLYSSVVKLYILPKILYRKANGNSVHSSQFTVHNEGEPNSMHNAQFTIHNDGEDEVVQNSVEMESNQF